MAQRKDREKANDPRRFRTYSFVATLGIIFLIIAVSYYQTLPSIGHIPDSFSFITEEWMAYVPANAQFVGYVNYQDVYSITGNSSIFGMEVILALPQIRFSLLPLDVIYELGIQLPTPQYSGSALILGLEPWKQNSLRNSIETANQTKITKPLHYDGDVVYGLLIQELGEKTPLVGYLAVVNNHLILSTDKTSALRNVEAILDQVSSSRPNIFDDITVRRGIYVTGATDQNYIALFVGRFPTQLNDTEMVTKTIVGTGDSIQVSRAFLFPSSGIALDRWDQAHSVYRNADSYSILDSWLVVKYNYPLSRLPVEVIGI